MVVGLDLAQPLDDRRLRDLHHAFADTAGDASGGALMTVDPDTLLPTGGIVEGFAAGACAPCRDDELLAPA